jgi:DNA polymerase
VLDVRALRAVSNAMRDLSAEELADYHVNERINDRGVLVDVELCKAAIRYAQAELVEIENIVAEVTKDEITSVRSPKMREWVLARVGEKAKALMKRDDKYSIDKTVRANLLAMEDHDEVPPDVAEVIQCADDLWASSVAKFSRLAQLADAEDGRVRGAFVFAGGSATGRYSSYGAQLHNMSRKCAKDPEAVRSAMLRGHAIAPKYGARVTDVLRGMLRPAIMAAKGRSLIALDWSAIEARVTPWCSADPAAETTLDVFRAGKDIYIQTAAAMFNKQESEVTKDDRMLGKVAVLACGFSGGVGAFASMGRIYGVNLPESDARRMVTLWRRANPWAQRYWSALETAMLRAMRNRGHEFSAGRVTYLFDGQHLWYLLPSGRVLCYPYAKFDEEGNVTFAKAAWKPAANAKEWPRARLWVGLQIENLVQASANCMLRYALREMDAAGIQVVASVHDEIVAECDDKDAETTYAKMQTIMRTAPAWAQGLPLDVEGSIMLRYAK